MSRSIFPLLLVVVLASTSAVAKRKLKDVVSFPSLEEVLTAAGWTMTPERAATYSVGDIYSRSTNTPVVFKDDCFDAEPREGAYTSLEVVQAMKAGARIPLGIAQFKAEGMQYKQLRFADPYIVEIASMHLVPNAKCRRFLEAFEDVDDLFVIKAILSAEVKEQLCRTLEGKAGLRGLGASGSINQECSQVSEGHVVVAYRTETVPRMLTAAPALGPEPATTAPGSAVPAVMNAAASVGGDFSGGAALDLGAKLQLQECEAMAVEAGARQRQARMVEARAGVQLAAERAWTAMAGDLERCMQLSSALQVDCERAVEDWLDQARSLTVEMPAGVEKVQTPCGELHPAFEVENQTFEADGLVDAERMLRRLQMDVGMSTSSDSTGTFSVVFRADPANVDTMHVMCHVGGFVTGETEIALPNAGKGPCRVDGFKGTQKRSATIIIETGGTYRCFVGGAPTCVREGG